MVRWAGINLYTCDGYFCVGALSSLLDDLADCESIQLLKDGILEIT